MKPVRVQLIGNAADEFENLSKTVGEEQANNIQNSERQQLLKSIKQKTELIKANPQYGDAVPKALIKRSGNNVDNLWVAVLTGYLRLFYILKVCRVYIFCFVLDFMDHKKYDKTFGYRKK